MPDESCHCIVLARILKVEVRRQFRHDGLEELFSAISELHEAGGLASLLPQYGKRHQRLTLPKGMQDSSLQIYLNVQIRTLYVPRRGPGACFEASWDTHISMLCITTSVATTLTGVCCCPLWLVKLLLSFSTPPTSQETTC